MLDERLLAWGEARVGPDKAIGYDDPRLRDLTIVIPSFRRPEYVVRQVAYWAFREANVIIVDGSNEPIGQGLTDLLEAIPNVRYLALDASYVDRIKHACGLVNTPYAMCLADDDMFLSAGLGSAIGLLERSPELSACMGQVIGLDYDQERSSAYFFPYGESLAGYEVSDDNASGRLRFAFDGYRTATSYALYRTPAFKDVWLGIDTISCLEATEYEHAIATYIGGKVATVPNLYWLRSFEAQPVDSVVDGTRKTDFPSWWNDDRFAAERAAFIERLTERLQKRSELSGSEAANALQELIDLILRKHHVGLVNRNKRLMLVTDLLGKLDSSPSARRWIGTMKTTRLGRKIRSTVLKSLRGPIETSRVAPGQADGGLSFPEREQLVCFLNDFHLAKDKGSSNHQ